MRRFDIWLAWVGYHNTDNIPPSIFYWDFCTVYYRPTIIIMPIIVTRSILLYLHHCGLHAKAAYAAYYPQWQSPPFVTSRLARYCQSYQIVTLHNVALWEKPRKYRERGYQRCLSLPLRLSVFSHNNIMQSNKEEASIGCSYCSY